MARPKEKDSESTNLKLEIVAKQNLTELAAYYKTSRTRVVEMLANERHALVFNSKRAANPGTDPVRELAGKLLSAGIVAIQGGESARPNSPVARPKPRPAPRSTPVTYPLGQK